MDPCRVGSRRELWQDWREGSVVYLVFLPLLQGTVSYNPVWKEVVPEGRTRGTEVRQKWKAGRCGVRCGGGRS